MTLIEKVIMLLPGGAVLPFDNTDEIRKKRKEALQENKSLSNEKHPRAKLSNEEVINIRQRYRDGEDIKSIHHDYGHLYSLESFKRIVFGQAYKTVGNKPKPEEIRRTNKGRKLGPMSDEDVRQIRAAYATGMTSCPKLARQYNVSIPTIASIIKRKFYKSVK